MVRTITPVNIRDLPLVAPDLPGAVNVDGFGLLGVSDFLTENTNKHWVQFLPWAEYSARPDVFARHATMARYLGRLTTLDTPGIGPFTSNLSPGLRRDIKRGNLKGVSEIQWAALHEVTGGKLDTLSLFGYGMGAPLAASFLREAPQYATVRSVALVEPMGEVGMHLADLSARLLRDSLERKEYKQTNPRWYRKLPHPLPPQTRDLHTYATMTARGEQFGNKHCFDTVATTVVSAEKSGTMHLRDVRFFAQYLNAEQIILEGENHSFIDSIGKMAWLSHFLSENN